MSTQKFKVQLHEPKPLTWWRARRAKIDMSPTYQRRGRLWSTTDKAFLIDSILNGYDVPKIYMADFTWGESQINTSRLPYAIIDGKQRFEAIFDFFDGTIVLNDSFVYSADESLDLAGLGYKDLQTNHPEVAELFETYPLTVMAVFATSDEPINELFVRLNRSKSLTGAEIRNAMNGPAPEVIRSVSKHDFFMDNIAFAVKRGADLNASAKLLLFEFNDGPTETKKKNLDNFAREAAEKGRRLELAARRVFDHLTVMSDIFLPRDRLLTSGGILPAYYWFIRDVEPEQYSRVREFLVAFEQLRKSDRLLADLSDGDPERELVAYGEHNRNTNDLTSHVERIAILKRRFSEWVSNKKLRRRVVTT